MVNTHAFLSKDIDRVNFTGSPKITTIETGAFANNNLTTLSLPSSVTEVSYEAFKNNKLTEITLSNANMKIYSTTFDVNEITSISLPSALYTEDTRKKFAVQDIPTGTNQVFKDLRNNNRELGTIAFVPTVIVGRNANRFIKTVNGKKSVSIPASIIEIQDYAFFRREIDTLEFLGTSAVKSISPNAFSDNNLIEITIPDSVTSVQENAFAYNKLTKVTLSKTLFDTIKTDSSIFASQTLATGVSTQFIDSATGDELTP